MATQISLVLSGNVCIKVGELLIVYWVSQGDRDSGEMDYSHTPRVQMNNNHSTTEHSNSQATIETTQPSDTSSHTYDCVQNCSKQVCHNNTNLNPPCARDSFECDASISIELELIYLFWCRVPQPRPQATPPGGVTKTMER